MFIAGKFDQELTAMQTYHIDYVKLFYFISSFYMTLGQSVFRLNFIS